MSEYELLKYHWLKGSRISSIKEDFPLYSEDAILDAFKDMFLKELGVNK